MMLTDLADTLRGAGLQVVEVPGWRTRGHAPMTAVQAVICHHTAGPTGSDHASLDVVVNGRSDLAGPLANLFLERDGTWQVVAAGLAYHAGAVRSPRWQNSRAVGIEAENDGKPPLDWPDVQIESFAKGCAALVRRYGLTVGDVLGHKEVCAPVGRKPDPDFDMNAFRRRVAALLNPPTPPPPVEEPHVITPEDRQDIVRDLLDALIDNTATPAARDGIKVRDLLRNVHRWTLFGSLTAPVGLIAYQAPGDTALWLDLGTSRREVSPAAWAAVEAAALERRKPSDPNATEVVDPRLIVPLPADDPFWSLPVFDPTAPPAGA